jgi:hypothetical protein
MNPKDHIPSLQATAATVLPGMRQARSLLDVSIRVLEYFEKHAASDAENHTLTSLKDIPPQLIADVTQVKAMLRAFGKLGGKEH